MDSIGCGYHLNRLKFKRKRHPQFPHRSKIWSMSIVTSTFRNSYQQLGEFMFEYLFNVFHFNGETISFACICNSAFFGIN